MTIKHGYVGTQLYTCWAHMKHRCSNENAQGYHRYGGRGIKVCDGWQSFEPFKDWAEANGYVPGDGRVLDRVDNDGGYSPSNCRWATKSQSMYNRGFPSPHPGVVRRPCGWQSRAGHTHIGYFDTVKEAVEARQRFFETGVVAGREVRRKRSDNSSGYRGVYQRATGKWAVKFKSKYLGQFDTFEKAVETRKEAERMA